MGLRRWGGMVMSYSAIWSLLYFFAGWGLGLALEYSLHVVMHWRSLKFHLRHHHDYFKLEPREVALNDLSPRLNVIFLAGLLLAASPLMLVVGVYPIMLAWAGTSWHILFVYEACHALIHYDKVLPEIITYRSAYRWWRGCHLEHHRHAPTGNFSVTCPVIDWVFGTYVHPKYDSQPIAIRTK